jgi:hypothetical protein
MSKKNYKIFKKNYLDYGWHGKSVHSELIRDGYIKFDNSYIYHSIFENYSNFTCNNISIFSARKTPDGFSAQSALFYYGEISNFGKNNKIDKLVMNHCFNIESFPDDLVCNEIFCSKDMRDNLWDNMINRPLRHKIQYF